MLVLPCAPSLASSALMDRKGDFERGRAAGEGDRRRRWCRGWCRGSGAALTLTAGVTASGPTVRRNEGGLFVYGPRRDCIQRNASAKKIDAAPYRQSALQEGPQIDALDCGDPFARPRHLCTACSQQKVRETRSRKKIELGAGWLSQKLLHAVVSGENRLQRLFSARRIGSLIDLFAIWRGSLRERMVRDLNARGCSVKLLPAPLGG